MGTDKVGRRPKRTSIVIFVTVSLDGLGILPDNANRKWEIPRQAERRSTFASTRHEAMLSLKMGRLWTPIRRIDIPAKQFVTPVHGGKYFAAMSDRTNTGEACGFEEYYL
jgi:hypothetical protein